MGANATEIRERYDSLASEQAGWLSAWREVRKYTHPRNAVTSTKKPSGTAPDTSTTTQLFDLTACHASAELAAAYVHWLCSNEDAWFRLDHPVKSSVVEDWCDKATEIFREEILGSNFYEKIMEVFLELNGPGTAAAAIGYGENGLEFESWRCGQFVFAENARGKADEVIRKYSLTAKAALQEFGDTCPKQVKDDAANPAKASTKHAFLHSVYVRKPDEIKAVNPAKREAGSTEALPIASCYVHYDTKTLVRESGMSVMPVAVGRYMVWPSDDESDEIFGYSPGFMALADARNANYLREQELTLAGIAAGPRVLIPKTHQGPVDLRRNGVTFVDDMSQAPREWATAGNFQIARESLEDCRRAIERVFQTQLVRQFGSLNKQMTATEVTARQREALVLFAPSVSRRLTEVIQPLLEAGFAMLYNRGAFPEVPQEMQIEGAVIPPAVKFTSRIVLAIEALKTDGFLSVMEIGGSIAAIKPDVLDNIDIDKGFRELARARGIDPDTIRPELEIDDMRAQRAEAQAAQQQQMMMMEAAKNPEIVKQVAAAQGGQAA